MKYVHCMYVCRMLFSTPFCIPLCVECTLSCQPCDPAWDVIFLVKHVSYETLRMPLDTGYRFAITAAKYRKEASVFHKTFNVS